MLDPCHGVWQFLSRRRKQDINPADLTLPIHTVPARGIPMKTELLETTGVEREMLPAHNRAMI